MAAKIATRFLGVRYREHPTRKHGGNRPDKCFFIRYKLNGKDKEEAVGWSSEGVTAESASKILCQLRDNARTGAGPRTYAELREGNKLAEQIQKEAMEQEQAENITFDKFWREEYLPNAILTKKEGSVASEKWLYKQWIEPIVGKIPLRMLNLKNVENTIAKAKKAGKSEATIRYILAVISQVWSRASHLDIVEGNCPCKKIKKPRKDNRRQRFLTREEAEKLLAALANHSRDMHDIALLSLHTGMRAGEIHALCWGNISLENSSIEIMDTKNKQNRMAFMTPEVKAMFSARFAHQTKSALVFPGKDGHKRKSVSDTFSRMVNELGLNDSGDFYENEEGEATPRRIADARQRVVFHTLRHTFASWLVQKGVPLYTVAELLGHSTLVMTKRYSHLAPDSLRNAAMRIGDIFRAPVDDEV